MHADTPTRTSPVLPRYPAVEDARALMREAQRDRPAQELRRAGMGDDRTGEDLLRENRGDAVQVSGSIRSHGVPGQRAQELRRSEAAGMDAAGQQLRARDERTG